MKTFNFSFSFCSSPLIENFDKNTTFPEALTPCLSFVLFPFLQIFSSLLCFLFLIVYGLLIKSPELTLTKILIVKLFLSFIVAASSITRIVIIYVETLYGNREIVIGNYLDLVSVTLLFASDFWRWRKGILSSIWVHISWTTRLCFATCQMIFIDYNIVSCLVFYCQIAQD